jgi:hypothetical protein
LLSFQVRESGSVRGIPAQHIAEAAAPYELPAPSDDQY